MIHHTRPTVRLNERHQPSDANVAWTTRPGQPLLRARIADQSDSGVGLLVDSAAAPHMGDAVRLVSRSSAVPRRARVVRVAADQNGKVRLGCRWIHSNGKRAHLRTPPARPVRTPIRLPHQNVFSRR